MLKLIWRETALDDLDAILAYIGQFDLEAADALQERIEQFVERLVQFPYMFRNGRLEGTREAVVHPNYILVYQVSTDAVEVINVLHSRRQYPPDTSES